MIKWRSTTIPAYGIRPLALHWRPTCSFRDPWRTPEKPRRTPLEKRWRAHWSTPNPHQKEISPVFPTEREPIPMENRWNWRIRWRKDELVRRIVIIHLNRYHTQKSSSSTISSTPSHHSVSHERKTFIIYILR